MSHSLQEEGIHTENEIELPTTWGPEEMNSYLASIVNSSNDAIISKNLDGFITSWNHAAEQIFGYSSDEMLGKSIMTIIPPTHTHEEELIISKIKNGVQIKNLDTLRLGKDGREVHLSVTISPIRDKKGNIIGASKIARDISERIILEMEKKRQMEQLRELNNMKNNFIGMAGHELKTPLTVASACLQILKSLTSGQQHSLVSDALSQVTKMGSLVDYLMDVAKIHAGVKTLDKRPVDIEKLITDIVASFGMIHPAHTIRFHNLTGKTLSPELDKVRIEQVMSNLINNAIKYAPDSDLIDIQLDQDEEQVTISVEDYGEGIKEEHLPFLFQSFYRIPDEKKKIPGSGLGLYFCKLIVDAHKGSIRVDTNNESKPKGCKISFSIPFTS